MALCWWPNVKRLGHHGRVLSSQAFGLAQHLLRLLSAMTLAGWIGREARDPLMHSQTPVDCLRSKWGLQESPSVWF